MAAALAVVGGIQLGESAVAEIDPIHFQGPAIHPRDRGAAIEEPLPPPARPRFAAYYGWAEGQAARAQDCGGCDAIAARDAYAEPAVVFEEPLPPPRVWRGNRGDYVMTVVEPETLEEEPDAFLAEHEDVVRYASYPISSEEAAPPADYAEFE